MNTTTAPMKSPGISIAIVLSVAALAWWQQDLILSSILPASAAPQESDGHADEHDHDHGHESEDHLAVSQTAMRNLGLTGAALWKATTQPWSPSLSVPGIAQVRPARNDWHVSAPLTGVVTRVLVIEGQAVEPGDALFEIRLTHEELVSAQTEFLKELGELDVELEEVARLEKVAAGGAVAQRTLLERVYARDRLLASLSAHRESLLLHGITPSQVQQIETDRRLISTLQIAATGRITEVPSAPSTPLIVSALSVTHGQAVMVGEHLCELEDLSQLRIEGHAWESDLAALNQLLAGGWSIAAVTGSGQPQMTGLQLESLGTGVDPDSRLLPFYAGLTNELLTDRTDTDGRRWVTWKYLPGQRFTLQLPTAEAAPHLVLPAAAVAEDGVEACVFRRNGDGFERVPVQVRHQSPEQVVLVDDGSLFPGDVVALKAAHQLLLALKNQSGGAVDPHHGHHH